MHQTVMNVPSEMDNEIKKATKHMQNTHQYIHTGLVTVVNKESWKTAVAITRIHLQKKLLGCGRTAQLLKDIVVL